MKAIHRLFVYLVKNNIPHTRFEKQIGVSNGYLKKQYNRNADLGEGVFNKILDHCPELSLLWLMRGIGKMESNKTLINNGITSL